MSEQKEKLPFHEVILERIKKEVDFASNALFSRVASIREFGEILRNSTLPSKEILFIISTLESFVDCLKKCGDDSAMNYLGQLAKELSLQIPPASPEQDGKTEKVSDDDFGRVISMTEL